MCQSGIYLPQVPQTKGECMQIIRNEGTNSLQQGNYILLICTFKHSKQTIMYGISYVRFYIDGRETTLLSVHVNGVIPKYFGVLNARETEEFYN
jgi:hypothetical protein